MAGPFADVDPEHLLFVYGTLLPGEERWELLEPFVVGPGSPDSVAGTLYDTGEGYPAASFEAGHSRVAGQVFQLDADRLGKDGEGLEDRDGSGHPQFAWHEGARLEVDESSGSFYQQRLLG